MNSRNELSNEEMSKKLFLIGNGFDIAHGLETRYLDYMMWLYKNDKNTFVEISDLILKNFLRTEGYYYEDEYWYYRPKNHVDERLEQSDAIDIYSTKYYQMLVEEGFQSPEILYVLWESLEENMKYVFLDDEVEAFEMEKESLLETLREEDYGEVIESDLDVFVKPALNYYNHIIDLSDRFNISLFRWVKEVDHTIVSICNKLVSEEDSEKIKLINLLPDDFFADSDYIVNFNYSDTIEHLYLKEVFHIHGCCRASHPPIMGHAEDPFTMRYYDDRTLTLVKKFYKKSEDIMNRNIDFFNKLSDVNEIIVLGLGYTNTDYCYFDKINKICPDAKWTLYYYRDKDKKNAELYVEKLGLKSNQIKEYVSIKEKSPYIQKMYY